MSGMTVACAVLAAAGVLTAVFCLAKSRRDNRKMERLSQQIEHFLLYTDGTLPESLGESRADNLNNQISKLEQLFLHERAASRRNEEQVIQFMENMAHQMKNAVTALQIQLDLLAMRTAPEERRSLQKSQACLERLTGEIERILKSSQLAAGKVTMEWEPVELRREVLDCAGRLKALSDSRRVCVEVTGLECVSVSGDAFWLSQALENLLKNAVEHTVAGSAVTVELSRNEHGATVRILDEGPGISPEELPEVFKRFHRGLATKAGYGIGLSMAKDIIQAHHGTVSMGNLPKAGAWVEVFLPKLEGKKAI